MIQNSCQSKNGSSSWGKSSKKRFKDLAGRAGQVYNKFVVYFEERDGTMDETKEKKGRGQKIDMLNGPMVGKLFLFALPLAASSILQQLFNSADVAVAGNFAGHGALAAVGANGPVINLLINLFVGLSVGANVVLANYMGRGRKDALSPIVHTSMALALVSGFCLIAVGWFAARPLLELMNTPGDVLEQAILYLRIYFVGMPFIMVYNFGAAILRSSGDTKRPLFYLAIAGVVNIFLNLFLVIVCGMGVAGVAVATVISNGISSSLILRALTKEEEHLRFSWRKLKFHRHYLKRIILIGAPAGLQSMVFSLSNVCIQSAINTFGSNAMAGSTAALNFEYFSYFIISAFNQACVTFTSQNFGAGKYDRCKKVFTLCFLIGGGLCEAVSLIFFAGAQVFIRVFASDPAVIAFAMIRVAAVMPFEGISATYEIGGAALRGIGHSMLPAILTVLGTCGVRIIWVFAVFPAFKDFGFLMSIYPISWVLTGGAVLGFYFYIRHKEFSVRS